MSLFLFYVQYGMFFYNEGYDCGESKQEQSSSKTCLLFSSVFIHLLETFGVYLILVDSPGTL